MGQPAVDAFIGALQERSDDAVAALHTHLADEVQVFGSFGVGPGPEKVDALITHPAIARTLTGATWSDPLSDGSTVTIEAAAPSTSSIGGLRLALRLDADGRIERIEQDLLPAAPLTPSPIQLDADHAALLAGALANGTPMITGYVSEDGRPRLSYRAAVIVLGPDQLGMWIREPKGGLLRALPENPNLTFFYSDRPKGVTLQFSGRGRVTEEEAIRTAIYDGSPEVERTMDWRRAGVAVVVDLDQVEGRDAGGRVLMRRLPG
jgi:hypothetical protein